MRKATARGRADSARTQGPVRLTVRENGEDLLIYTFASLCEAARIHAFVREFFPRADFVLEPLAH